MATNKMSTVEEEEIDLLALAKYLFHYVVWIVAICRRSAWCRMP